MMISLITAAPCRSGRARPVDGWPRVLVLEDDRAVRVGLGSLLERRGLPVAVAADGTAVVQRLIRAMAGAQGVDVVIADVDAPGCSGLDILALVRDRRWPVRVVLTARLLTGALRAELLRRGAAAVLEHPRTEKQWNKILQNVGRPYPPRRGET
jgi:CheY-like chemotaxis protein